MMRPEKSAISGFSLGQVGGLLLVLALLVIGFGTLQPRFFPPKLWHWWAIRFLIWQSLPVA